jgi:diguanylate cyclase (GGDEF)-like protein
MPRPNRTSCERILAAGRGLAASLRRFYIPLAPEDRPDFDAEVDRQVAHLLPVLGPVLGAFVILFGVWDAWIDPGHAGTTLRIRVGLVLLGSLSYARGRLPWSDSTRCRALYLTHVGAMTISAALLEQGLLLALPGLTGAMFIISLVEPRSRRWLSITLPAALLFMLLAAQTLPRKLFLESLLLYSLSGLLACMVAGVSLQLRRRAFLAEKALLHASRYDSLSGALSRGYVTELAVHDVALARRYGHSLAVAMLDIDFFKRVNDTWGHAMGDIVLAAVASTCRQGMRASDYLGRVGGEEFVCVMPEASAGDAMACAERIRKDIAALRVPTPSGPLQVTVSLGIAVLDDRYGDWDALLGAADAALYQAKGSGRNRSVLATPSGPPEPAPAATAS